MSDIQLYEEELDQFEDDDDVRLEDAVTPKANPPEQPEPSASIFDGLLEDSNAPAIKWDCKKMAEEIALAYPEPQGLQFLVPEPLRDVEAHLKASKAFLALKADTLLVKLAETHSLMARPLTDAMSCLASTPETLDSKILAERLSDITKTLIIAAKLTENARIEIACQAFRVPTSTAKIKRGHSLLGQSFAKNVERLRKDKKVLLGEDTSTSSIQRYRPYSRPNQDRSIHRRIPWKQQGKNTDWYSAAPRHNTSNTPNSTSRGSGSSATNSTSNQPGTLYLSLVDFATQWELLTSDDWILSTVRGYRISFLSPPFQPSSPHPIHFSQDETNNMDTLVNDLLAKGAIIPVTPQRVRFLSNLFLVAKKGTSKFRPVINLKPLNEFIANEKFKMEGWLEIKEAVFPDCYFTRIDLKDAFLSIPIHTSSQPYLAFRWQHSTYCWARLPFGLKTSPRVFTKLLKPVAANLRQRGVVLIVYLDDFLLIANSPSRLTEHTEATTSLLQSLGYTINFEKSSLIPAQRVTYLGYNIDSATMRLSVPGEKLLQIKRDINLLLETSNTTLRTLYRVLGKLNALTTIVRSLRYHCSSLARLVSTTTRRTRNLEAIEQLPSDIRSDLEWWTTHLDTIATGPIRPPLVSLEITSDSSLQGWGAWCSHGATGGAWNDDDRHLHINALELKAIFLAVQRLAKDCSNTTIAIRTDNTNAMHSINNFGSLHSPTLNSLSRQIWAWAFDRNLHLKATYIPGVLNDIADTLSRTVLDNHSYSLHQATFDRLNSMHGPFQIDLFADFSNHEVDTYFSWVKDPFAIGVDAFLSRWDSWTNLYAFPPFKLVDRTLSYLDSLPTCELTLICPLWPTQPCFPRLLQRCIDQPILLPSDINLILDRTNTPHPLMVSQRLQLVAWRLAPLNSHKKRRAFWKTLSAQVHVAHTTHAGAIGYVGVDNEIPLHIKFL
ncbi:uncharacterized protein LOC108863840 [Galendromus occidentalis]|uniref:Uncharacterized protein LOC108863840 n=1 Tax=Galendromus occidentalis TaxID=34638 RepID=A0AAJ7L4C9_9ACAR|nr:uncharacterized protein LOC108863840 [Galendromus occidentalis]